MDSGQRAYELFSRAAASGRSPFDLVIMDMVLGEALDGLQVIEQIQRLFPAQKVIVASGHAPGERAAAGHQARPHLAGEAVRHGHPGRDRAAGAARGRGRVGGAPVLGPQFVMTVRVHW